jgi:hypothetical protein
MRALTSEGPSRELPASLPEKAAVLFGGMARFGPVMNHTGRSVFGAGWDFRDGMPEAEAAMAAFHRHTQTVTDTIPAERLLVFDVRDGWNPCDGSSA